MAKKKKAATKKKGAKKKKKAAKRKATKKKAKKKKAVKKKAVKKKKATKKKAVKKKKAKKKKPKKKAARKKRVPNAAFMRPMQPDAALAAIVGSKPIPRTEITKKLWQYIKRLGLQDSVNRRNINADANLRVVFGGKAQVSMFEMTKLVSKHMS